MAEDDDSERATEEFYLKQMCNLRIFDSPESPINGISDLLCVSNIHGFILAGGEQVIKMIEVQSIEKLATGEDFSPSIPTKEYHSKELKSKHRISHIALNSSNSTLAVVFLENGNLHLGFADVSIFYSQEELTFVGTMMLMKEEGSSMKMMHFHPSIPNIMAICLSNGKVSLLEINKDAITVTATWKGALPINAIYWSPKGKSLILGQNDGKLLKCDKALECKKEVAVPDIFDGVPQQVCHLHWISTFMVGVTYKGLDADSDPHFVIVTSQRDGPTNFQSFGDIYFGFNDERMLTYYSCDVPEWQIVCAGASNSFVTVVLGAVEGKWYKWTLKDSGNADLPLSENKEETFPLGLAISYNSSIQVKEGESALPPTPLLLTLSTDGILSCFHMINNFPQAKLDILRPTQQFIPKAQPQVLKTPPLSINQHVVAEGTLSQRGQLPQTKLSFTSNVGGSENVQSSMATGILSGGITSLPPAQPFSQLQKENIQKASPFSFSSVPKSTSTLFNPPQNTFLTSKPMPSVQPSDSLTDTPRLGVAPSTSVEQVVWQPKPVPTWTPTTSLSTGLTAAAQVPTNQSFPSATLVPQSEKNVQSSVPVPVATGAPTGPFSSSFPSSFLQSGLASKGTVFGAAQAPVADLKVNAPSGQMTDVMKSAESRNKGSGVEKEENKVSEVSKGPAFNNVMLNSTEEKAKQNLQDESVIVDREIMSMIKAEIETVSAELKSLKASEKKLKNVGESIGTQEEALLLRKETEDVAKLVKALHTCCKDQDKRVTSLKSKMLKCFDHLQEIQSMDDKSQDPRYISLLKLKPLDTVTELQRKEIRSKFNTVENLLSDVNEALDIAWEKRATERDRRKRSLKFNNVHNLYRSMESVNKITNNLSSRVEALYREAGQRRLISSDKFFAQERDRLDSSRKDYIGSFMDQSSSSSMNTSVTGNLSASKNAELRHFLMRRTETPIRRSKQYSTPVRPSLSSFAETPRDGTVDTKVSASPIMAKSVVSSSGRAKKVPEDLPSAPPNTPAVARSTSQNISLASLRQKLETEIGHNKGEEPGRVSKGLVAPLPTATAPGLVSQFTIPTKTNNVDTAKVSHGAVLGFGSSVPPPATFPASQNNDKGLFTSTFSFGQKSISSTSTGQVNPPAVPSTDIAVGKRFLGSSAQSPPPNVTVPVSSLTDPRLPLTKISEPTKDQGRTSLGNPSFASRKEDTFTTGVMPTTAPSSLSLSPPTHASTPLHVKVESKGNIGLPFGIASQELKEKPTPSLQSNLQTPLSSTNKLKPEVGAFNRTAPKVLAEGQEPTLSVESNEGKDGVLLDNLSQGKLSLEIGGIQEASPSQKGMADEKTVASSADLIVGTTSLPQPVSQATVISSNAVDFKVNPSLTEAVTSSISLQNPSSLTLTGIPTTSTSISSTQQLSQPKVETAPKEEGKPFGTPTGFAFGLPSASSTSSKAPSFASPSTVGFGQTQGSTSISSGAVPVLTTFTVSEKQPTATTQTPVTVFPSVTTVETKTLFGTSTSEKATNPPEKTSVLGTPIKETPKKETFGFSFSNVSASTASTSSKLFPSSGTGFGSVAQNTSSANQGQQENSGGLFQFFGLGGKPNDPGRNPFGDVPTATSQTPGIKATGLGTSPSMTATVKPNTGTTFGSLGSGLGGSQGSAEGTVFGGGATFGGAPAFGGAPTFGGSPAFGGSPTFGGSPAFGGAAFGAAPTFGTGTTFGSGSTFGSASTFGSPSANAPVFGQSASGSPSFGQLAAQDTGPTFGAVAPSGGGGGGFGGFGSLAQQTPSFGSQTPSFGSQTPSGSSFSSWR